LTSRGKDLKYTVIVSLTILAAIFFSIKGCLRQYPFGNHQVLNSADNVSWLPRKAQEVFARNSGSIEVYEFLIPETGFLHWADKKGLPVTPIKNEKKIYRYHYFDFSSPIGNQPGNKAELDAYYSKMEAQASNGYYGESRNPDGSGWAVMYDSERKKAYYWWVLR